VTVSVWGISEEGSSNELICEYDLDDDAGIEALSEE
jgi:hypothetical protein